MKPFSILLTLFLLVASPFVAHSQQTVRAYFSNSNPVPVQLHVQATQQAQLILLGDLSANASTPVQCVPGQFYHLYANNQLLGTFHATATPDQVIDVPTVPASQLQNQSGQQQSSTTQMNQTATGNQNAPVVADPKDPGTTAENVVTFTFADVNGAGEKHTMTRRSAPNGRWNGTHPDFNEYFANQWYHRKLTGNQFLLTRGGAAGRAVTFVVDLDTNVIWMKEGENLSNEDAEARLQRTGGIGFDSYRRITHASNIQP